MRKPAILFAMSKTRDEHWRFTEPAIREPRPSISPVD
jgi:hypothetical protein